MKTIIACTDFSPIASNAVHYAAALAKVAKARLVLFHYYDYPTPATDLQGIFPNLFQDKLANDLEKKLQHVRDELAETYHIMAEGVVRSLDLSVDLEAVFQHEEAGLVVMGMQGQSAVNNALFGNVAAGAIRRGRLPLLLIPKGVAFQPVKKILFPCDNHDISDPDTLRALEDLTQVFDAYIEVLTLFDLGKTPELAPKNTPSATRDNLEMLLAKTRHGYSYENEVAVDEGILYEAARSSADMVAMIPHHHSFMSSLLNRSETQRVAAAITIPLLVLGERAHRV